jgi:predicted RNA-binding protein with PIN domain
MTPRYLVIDGHSVLFSWPDLRALHQRQPRQAREDLTRRLERLHDTGRWEVTLVFDGKAGAAPSRRPGDMVVAYSRRDQTADSVIEGLVASQKDRSTVTVVTADGAEKTTVEALGAFCASPDWLRLEMESVQADFEETFAQFRRRAK